VNRIAEYTIDHSRLDWPALLDCWTWLVPRDAVVLIMNRFGDLFVELQDGSVHMLDVGRGSFEQVAASRHQFTRLLDEPGNAADWLMIPLVDALCAAGITLAEGQCYTYRQLPVLGGGYAIDNVNRVSIQRHYRAVGPIHEKIEDLPDGTRISFDTEG